MSLLKGSRVLITGGAGFIGFHLSRELCRLGAEVKVFDNLSAAGGSERAEHLRKLGVNVVIEDILTKKSLFKEAEGSDTIFHLAAMSSVPLSYKKPRRDCQINVLGTVNVLEAARRLNAKVVFTSSSTVYGFPKEVPTPEDHPLEPISFYGLSKLVAEQYCQVYHQIYGLPVVTLRLFNVYGPEARTGVTYDFLKKIKTNNKRLEVIGTGEQSKDFVYVDDTVEATLRAAESRRAVGEVYNLGSGETTNVVKLAETIIAIIGLDNTTKIVCGLQEDWPGDVSFTHADVTKIGQHLGWTPKTKIEDGLRQTIKWFESAYGPILH